MKVRSFKCRMCGACCRINPVKPDKCRTFTFEWTNPDSAEVCPALAGASVFFIQAVWDWKQPEQLKKNNIERDA